VITSSRELDRSRCVLVPTLKENEMNSTKTFLAITILLLTSSIVLGQNHEVPKYEVAGEFTTLERDAYLGSRTEPGFGGHFTFNLDEHVSLEGGGYFFPRRCFDCVHNGLMTEVLGGVKVGKRFERWGLFAKVRPGVVSFSEGEFNILPSNTNPNPAFPFK